MDLEENFKFGNDGYGGVVVFFYKGIDFVL